MQVLDDHALLKVQGLLKMVLFKENFASRSFRRYSILFLFNSSKLIPCFQLSQSRDNQIRLGLFNSFHWLHFDHGFDQFIMNWISRKVYITYKLGHRVCFLTRFITADINMEFTDLCTSWYKIDSLYIREWTKIT